MLNFIRSKPALGGMILSVLGALLGFYLQNHEMVASLLTTAGIFLGVHQVVVPVNEAVAHMTEAATATATKVVANIDSTVVGKVGQVLPVAEAIITSTVNEVVGEILTR